jgi:3-hydroxyacyl-CoA dehydrogenase
MAKIAVIGSGLIGQGWAIVFAKAGFDVAMYDAAPEAAERAKEAMDKRVADLLEFDLVVAADAPAILKRITVAQSIEKALQNAIYVQESGPERVEFKRELTEQLDACTAPDVPIGSSTSGISASRDCEDIPGRHRCLVVHPINPPHLIPAVEIVPTPWTDPGIVTRVTDMMDACRRETIVLNKEIDGFVVNRLQGALLEEAFKLVGSGIVSAADLDKAICDGLGLRWSFMGPMQTIHLNAPEGVAQYVERYGDMYRGFDLGPYTDIDWKNIVETGLGSELETRIPIDDIPSKQVERDRKLMALLRHKARQQA